MKNVVIGFLGSQLDAGSGSSRWEKWRPTVSICQHEDFVVERLELLHARQHTKLAAHIKEDIESVSPRDRSAPAPARSPRCMGFQEVHGLPHEFARTYRFQPERERYLMHITTGTHVAQICMFILTEARYFPAGLLQSSPARRQGADSIGALLDHRSRSVAV